MSDLDDYDSLASTVTEVIFDNGCMNDPSFTKLDFSRFVALRLIDISDHCCLNVEVVEFTGLKELESIVIGNSSFTRMRFSPDPHCHLVLKNCPRLKGLKIGRHCFMDYSYWEIENVDALEVIEMGDLDTPSFCFRCVPLELRSV